MFVLQVEIQVNLGYSQRGFLPLGRARRVEIDSASGHNHTELIIISIHQFAICHLFCSCCHVQLVNEAANLMIAKPLGPLILVA